jgi:tetratricopeptide (TPR) repeat protein
MKPAFLTLLLLCFSSAFPASAQVIVRPATTSEDYRWPRLEPALWPESVRTAHSHAMRVNGDDDRREALLVLVAQELRRQGRAEQAVALAHSLQGARRWWECASLAGHLWETGGDKELAEKLYRLAESSVALLGPPQRQVLFGRLASAAAASATHEHQPWLDQVTDQDLRQQVLASCLLRQARQGRTKITGTDIARWAKDGEKLESPISRLYLAQGLLELIEGLVAAPGESKLERDAMRQGVAKAVELAEKSTAINTAALVQATRLLQAQGVEDQAGSLFELTLKRLGRTVSSAEWRPGLLVKIAAVAELRERDSLAAELRSEAVESCREVIGGLRGEAAVETSVLLAAQKQHDLAHRLLEETSAVIAANPNPNVRQEYLCRLHLGLAQGQLRLSDKLRQELARMAEGLALSAER